MICEHIYFFGFNIMALFGRHHHTNEEISELEGETNPERSITAPSHMHPPGNSRVTGDLIRKRRMAPKATSTPSNTRADVGGGTLPSLLCDTLPSRTNPSSQIDSPRQLLAPSPPKKN